METKKPWQSRTMVLNALMGLAAAASLFIPQAHVVPDYISANPTQVALIWSILNMVLRAVTKDKVSLGD